MALLYEDLTNRIIGAAFRVHNILGRGFLERAYRDALCIELADNGIAYEQEKVVNITYRGHVLPHAFVADIVVEGKVILELKAAKMIDPVHIAQLTNYLKASGIRVGFVINFGTDKMTFERIIC